MRLSIVPSLLAAALATTSAHAQDITPSPAFEPGALTAFPVDGWPTNGGDIYNRRYSPLDEINRDNVAGLRGVWRTHLGSGLELKYSGEAQPLVYDGVIFVVTGADDVFALSVETGEILWAYYANLDPEISTVCCGWTSRGVALGDGKIFVGQLDGRLVALDQQTGEIEWSAQAEQWQDGFTITSAPLYFDGLVVTGFAGGDRGTRGRVKAYNASDGSHAWTFYTIPPPGEPGHETWPQDNEAWRYGGAAVWQTPAADPELGLIFFSTGNPGPDLNGAYRAGDNLYSTSMIAVDARTGEYRWHFQQVRHDLWDFDAASPVVLFDIEIDGVERKAIAEASKTGWVYILDRTNGEPLIGMEYRAVPQEPRQATAATQPFPVGDPIAPLRIDIPPEGYSLVNDGQIYTPFWTEPAIMRRAGVNWPPSSYDPDTGLLYVCGSDRNMFFMTDPEVDLMPDPTRMYMEGRFRPVGGSTGIFAAMDMRTNEVVWRFRWPDNCFSGSVATGGGLVFVGRNDGRLTALDSANGDLLWEFQTGAGMNAPASVFEHDGTQYVVAYSAGNSFARTPRGDSIWLFSLDGTLEEAEAAVTALPTAVAIPAGRAADIEAGRQVYNSACVFCHGPDGEGSHEFGSPLTAATNPVTIMQVVTRGQNELMPAFGSSLTPGQIQDVAAYVAGELPH